MLGRFIQRQCAASIPNGSRRVRFHWIVVAIGRAIGLLDSDGAPRNRGIGITN